MTEISKKPTTFITFDEFLEGTLTPGERIEIKRKVHKYALAANLRDAKEKNTRHRYIERKVELLHSRTHKSWLDYSPEELERMARRLASPTRKLRVKIRERKHSKRFGRTVRYF